MARGAGANIAGIFGSQNWDWKLENQLGSRYSGTNAFVKSFGEKYGFPPSQAAHTCYVQTMLYADAVTRAGSLRFLRPPGLGGPFCPIPPAISPPSQAQLPFPTGAFRCIVCDQSQPWRRAAA